MRKHNEAFQTPLTEFSDCVVYVLAVLKKGQHFGAILHRWCFHIHRDSQLKPILHRALRPAVLL
jgi:hypothetical protein